LNINPQWNEQNSMLLIIVHSFKCDDHKGIKTIDKYCKTKLNIRRIIQSYSEIKQRTIRNLVSILIIKVVR